MFKFNLRLSLVWNCSYFLAWSSRNVDDVYQHFQNFSSYQNVGNSKEVVCMSPMKSENKGHFEKVNVEVQNFYIFTHKKSKYQKRRHYLLIEIQRLYSLEVSSSCIRNQCREKLFPVKILVWSWNLPFLTRIKDVEAWLS